MVKGGMAYNETEEGDKAISSYANKSPHCRDVDW